jgi:hypothetical protein
MLKIVSEILAKLWLSTHRDRSQALADPLTEKMRNLKWVPTEDDRSAQKYLTEDAGGSKNRAPLAEIMATSYLGRSGEPFE